MALLCLISSTAAFDDSDRYRIRYAATIRGLLEVTVGVMTKTLVLARLDFINFEELKKTEFMFSRECPETKTLKCLILGLIKTFFYL